MDTRDLNCLHACKTDYSITELATSNTQSSQFLIIHIWDGETSLVKSIYCPCRGLRFHISTSAPTLRLTTIWNPVSGVKTPSSGLLGQCTHVAHLQVNTKIQRFKKKIFVKETSNFLDFCSNVGKSFIPFPLPTLLA